MEVTVVYSHAGFHIIVLTSQEGHLRDLYNLDQSVADHQDLGFGMDQWKCQQALDWKLGMDSIWIPGMEIWIRWNYQCGQVLLCVLSNTHTLVWICSHKHGFFSKHND